MDLSNPDRAQSVAPTESVSSRFTARSDTLASPLTRPQDDDELLPSTALARRSPWQAIMVEAGGISAAVSDESMRKLKYCLEWLQWATANLDTQITLLETFIASINASVTGEPIPPSATVSPEALQHYMSVKRNVVSTIRQVVEVVGKYAGGSLPEPAKQKVKGFILSLPGRWSMAVRDAGLGNEWEAASPASNGANAGATENGNGLGTDVTSTVNPRKRNRLESSSQSLASEATTGSSSATVTGTAASTGTISTVASSVDLASPARIGSTSGSASTSTPSSSTATPAQPGVKRSQLLPPTAGAARHAAHRVLTLAQESLHAVKGVTGVFKDTLERAETWVDRFRRVGYGPGHRHGHREEDDEHHLRPHKSYASTSSHSQSTGSVRSSQDRRRMQTPRELHLEALARSIPSVGPYGPYGTGTTPPMSPVLAPEGSTYFVSSGSQTSRGANGKVFPFDNPAPGAPGYSWGGAGGRRKSDSGLSAVPTLNLSEHTRSGRSRAGSYSQYESSTGESLPPPSVGSTSSVADDEEEDQLIEERRTRPSARSGGMGGKMKDYGFANEEAEEGVEYRSRKRRRKDELT